jgi:hypothetical protein
LSAIFFKTLSYKVSDKNSACQHRFAMGVDDVRFEDNKGLLEMQAEACCSLLFHAKG